MALMLGVSFVIKAVVKVQGIAEAAAAAGSDANSQDHVIAEVVLLLEPLDLFCCSFAQFDCHLEIYPSSWTRIGQLENLGVPLLERWPVNLSYY